MADLPSNCSVIGRNINFHGSVVNSQSGGVTITPVPASVIGKVLLKAVTKKAKKDPKTFTLRNINTLIVRSPDILKKEIRQQFKDDVTSEFDIGYQAGSSVVYIRNSQDLIDIWNDIIVRGQKHVLWCDGLKGVDKKRSSSDSDDEFETNKSKKKRKVDDKKE